MKSNWHETIQRYLDGLLSAEEVTELHEALYENAELRALYLDYINLDVALGTAAEAALLGENGIGKTAIFPRPPARLSTPSWRWLGATAACAALVVFAMLSTHRDSSRARPDIDATLSSTQSAIARLSVEPASPLPAWMSPTASLLDQSQTSE